MLVFLMPDELTNSLQIIADTAWEPGLFGKKLPVDNFLHRKSKPAKFAPALTLVNFGQSSYN
jgi:hypothetical protein